MLTRLTRKPSGITLLETLLAALVLAMAVTAIIMPFTAAAQSTAQDARATLAVNLAQELMEEILATPFRDGDGTQDGETGRINWDDIGDYNNYVEGEGSIAGIDGVVVDDPAAVGLSRRVATELVYVSGQDTAKPATFYRVTVEVLYHGATVAKLTRLVFAND